MNKANLTTHALTLFLAAGGIAGCERSPKKSVPAKPTATATEDAHAEHDQSIARSKPIPSDALHADAKPTPPPAPETDQAEGTLLTLEGLTMRPDPRWVAVPIKPGPMAPVAAFAIPAESSDDKPIQIRITHYPAMKGPQMDRRNIERWTGSVRRPDGTPATMQDAAITIKTIGHVRLTVVDITGTVAPTMGGPSAGIPNQRLIAAIVDHPKGPHFVKAIGPVATIDKWAQPILAFLDSATVTP